MKDYINIPNSLINEMVEEYVKGERNRHILKDRLINQMCYEPLAEKYDVSVPTIKRIIYKYEYVVLNEARKAVKRSDKAEPDYTSLLPLELLGT